MSTLLFKHADVVRYLDSLLLLSDLRGAFRADALGRTAEPQRVRAPVHAEGAAFAQLPGTIPGVPAYSVKVHSRFPAQLPPQNGLLQLHDLTTGELLALMDARHLTAVRAGVVTALAADVLARVDASRVALIGAGDEMSLVLKCLRLVRTLSHVRVFDVDPARGTLFAIRMYSALQLPVRTADTVGEAVADADLVITAHWGHGSLLVPGSLPAGAHLSTFGAHPRGRCEASAALLERARVVCDHRGLAVEQGAVGAAGLGEDVIDAELGEVLARTKPGRTSAEEVTVFAGVGLPFEDLAAAWQVYEAGRDDEALQRVDFTA